MLSTVAITTLEAALNAWLRLDGESLQKLRGMEGKVIRFHVTGLELNLYFFPGEQDIHVLGEYEHEADATIHGSAMSLMRLGTSDNAGKTLLDSDASIDGDMQLANGFSDVLKQVDIDWEELLSHAVGDIIAHQAGQIGREATGWLKDTHTAMRMNTAEYLTEESRVLPADSEVAYYMDQVDSLRMDTDRLDAKINRLKGKLDS